MQSEGIAGVKDAAAVIEGEDRVGPVQVRSTQEFEAMLHAAVWTGAQIQLVAGFHRTGFEGAMHLVFEELDRHLRTHDLDVGIEIDQIADQS